MYALAARDPAPSRWEPPVTPGAACIQRAKESIFLRRQKSQKICPYLFLVIGGVGEGGLQHVVRTIRFHQRGVRYVS